MSGLLTQPMQDEIQGLLAKALKVPPGILTPPPDIRVSAPPPPPVAPDPWSWKLGTGGFKLNLPAPKGASFHGYVDWRLRPNEFRFDGLGLKYQQEF